MSECPAFYCSRCNISHADECPPPKKVWPTKGFTIEPKGLTDQDFLDLMSAPPALTIINGYSPTVGTRWLMENKVNDTDPWCQMPQVWEVRVLGLVSITLRHPNGSHSLWLYEHWYADGWDDGNGLRMRFVPAP